jgi:hypothetical protein
MREHGNVSWSEIEASLGHPPKQVNRFVPGRHAVM